MRHAEGVLSARRDSHYCGEPVRALLEAAHCDYILGLAINPKLAGLAGPWLAQCDLRRSPDARKVRRFHPFQHRAGSWSRTRSIVARVEATELGTDARFVVTSLNGRGKFLYEKVYCARGRMENPRLRGGRL